MATEDLCIVCADSLDYTGFGPCGHKDACSRCVARLRFVLEDNKCMICKQANAHVYFTRYMGDYTERPEDFSQQYLMSRVQNGELHELPEVSGYFDDLDHYKQIKSLCSYTHPMMMGATFGTLAALKRKLQEQHKLHFCDLCIKGRKVFISEQVLYSKQDLEKHMRTGDDAGPMADSGFKGHPLCRFCRQRFYDGDELYKHMEGRHEHCFICRKLHPHKFVYYKDYAELEEHFQSQHHPCPHPVCLERKFVVFFEEAELKRHFAAEHGADMNMSRAQRRQALSINIQLQYNQDQEAAAAAAALSRPGVVIGGGHNLPRRGMRHSRSDGAMAAALQASLESNQAESLMRQSAAEAAAPSSVTFSAEDFPTVSGAGAGGTTPLGTWVGASPSGPGSVALTHDDFPALPSMSRNQRRRQREREKNSPATLAGRLAAANAPIRVVNRAAAPAASSTATAAAAAAAGTSSRPVHHSSSTGSLASAVSIGLGSLQAEDAGAYADGDVSSDPAAGVDDFPALGGGLASAPAPAGQAHPAWVPVRRGKAQKAGQGQSSSSSSGSKAAGPPSVSDFPSLAATVPASAKQAASSKAAGSSGNKGRLSSAGSKSSSSSSSSNSAGATQTVAAAVAAAGGVSEELKAANKALIDRIKAILSEEGFKEFREQSAGFIQGAMPAGDYHGHVVQLGLLSLVPQLAALCPDVDKRAALLTAHKQHINSFASTQAAPASTKGWVPPEAAMAALQEAEQKGSWSCERCTLVNAPESRACEVCSAPRPMMVAGSSAAGKCGAAGSTHVPAGQQQQQQQQFQPQQQQPPSQWSSAAAALAAGLRQQPSRRAETPAAALPPAAASPLPAMQASADGWPSLAGPSSSARSADAGASGSSSGSSSMAVPAAEAEAAAEAPQQEQQPLDGKGGKKKKGTKTSLQDLLASGKSHPQNAWSQQQRRQQVVAAPAGQRASMGSWKAGGGSKLAKKISAINDAWGE